MKYKRWQYSCLEEALKTRRVLVLAGPRQCGKTTLAKEFAGADVIYRTLDNITLMEAALSDPNSFIKHDNKLMIIDEIQRAPVLLQAIKQEVDSNTKPGRFLLTGSANIQSLPGVVESLAGRVRKIRLRPLAYGEINSRPPAFLSQAYQETFNIYLDQNLTKDQYIIDALLGGYPEARLLSSKEAKDWYRDYLHALMERDLKDITNIKHHDVMQHFLEILSAWSSKFMDISGIGSNLALSRQTIQAYINALEALYLVERLKPWLKTDYERVNKHHKLFMTDTGTMATLLRWKLDNVRLDGEKNGKLLETFVFNQLSAHIDAQSDEYQIFHYRDREKREIDFIIENENEELLGIEVKAGTNINIASFKHLLWFQKNHENKKFIGIILYTGQEVLSFGKKMWAVPISALY